jgi:signal transduction histidine kinase/CheY-like chemotaxis protein/HPt (histidine-containing phosphotransfer) domain-containing protein
MAASSDTSTSWRVRVRRRLAALGIRHQLILLFGLCLLAGTTVLVIDEVSQYRARQSLLTLKDDSLQRMGRLKEVSDAYGLGVVDTTFRVRNFLMPWEDGVVAVDAMRGRIDRNWSALVPMPRNPEQQKLFDEVARERVVADRAIAQLRAILLARDMDRLGRFADTALYPAIDPVTRRIQALSAQAMVQADALVRADLERSRRVSALRIGVSLLTLLVVALVGQAVLRNAYRGVESLVFLVRRMRAHDYTAQPRFQPRGELALVMEAFAEMRRDVLTFETELIDQLARNEAALSANERLQSELRDSEARAQAANQAKSSFLAAMSHEIRTPMIGITGMVEVLSHSRLEPDQRHALNIIQQSSQSLLQIIGDILDFSKIEADRLELAPEPVSLPKLLRDTVSHYTGAASSRGLALACKVDERVAPAHRVDPMRLRQVLSNFLTNALKFTEQGGVEVALEWVGEADAGPEDALGRERLVLRVTDTGIGVSAEAQARLFQPFSQAEGDTTRRFGGTGLGLVISRRLAELMGGSIRMDSVPGEGTTMRLELVLPRARADEVLPAVPVAALAALVGARRVPGVAEAEAERSLILLVDDHPTNRLVIARQLALAGYASEAAEDGMQGLQRWRSGRYALVLSDIHMPGLDGYQLAGAIRQEEARDGKPRTPIIALTASALKGEAERCLGAGMDDYLAKPVSVPVLQACLQRWLPHAATQVWDEVPALFAAEAQSGTPPGTAFITTPPDAGVPPELPELDGTTLETLTGGDPADARALMVDFLASTAEDLAALDAARAAADDIAWIRQAHKIKGAARLVGAPGLAAAAAALEAAGHRHSAGNPSGVPGTLFVAVHAAARQLERFVAEHYG